jgi:hypothetical protein
MLVFLLLTRSRPSIRALFTGSLISLALLLPYLAFEAPRGFSDLRAFLSRSVTISPDIMAQYESIKPGGAAVWTPSDAPPEAEFAPASLPPIVPPSRLERAVNFALSLPGQFIQALWLFTQNNFSALDFISPVMIVPVVAFGAVIIGALMSAYMELPSASSTDEREHHIAAQRAARHILLLLAFVGVICAGLILTRASPSSQMTYYTGLVSLQWLMVAGLLGGLFTASDKNLRAIVPFVLLFTVGNAAERIARVAQHDDAIYSRFNVALYRHIEAATDYIVSDWNRADPVTVSYDILPEMDNLWWVLPWHTVDSQYRMGTPFDVLLELNHGVENRNQSADGLAENADYIVVYTPGLARYDVNDYEQAQFGAIVVLKEKQR